ncbi:MAG: ATP-dependent DNA helicase RecG [Bacteroidales bacterium]|jgi:ATP-dependent DNA helicase RecG|nr:ATP-dependent DNA helicase RecG [Bacteroidales bacterium]
MDTAELIEIISRDEDSKHQFKANIYNADQIATEMVAFCNSGGGRIFVGVNDDGSLSGLTREDIGRINQLVSNAANNNMNPPINPITENITLNNGIVMVITILDGISKPYMDKLGAIWVKSGADKRRVTSREEIQRMFQASGIIHADETPANGMTITDIDLEYFSDFLERVFGEKLDEQKKPLSVLLENMNLAKSGILNIAGALLFSKSPQYRLPAYIAKGICYEDNNIHADRYIESIEANGKIADVFQTCVSFIMRNIPKIQKEQNVNSIGQSVVPKIVFEELLANAFIHRDYFISAPVRIFIFSNRIEIISPGHLPNNLTVQNIINGNSNIRNPILASFATRILPYRGLGNGIRRALEAYPNIDFIDDREGNLFKVIIKMG